MTNCQKGIPVGFLPLKTLNNFLRIEHKDLFFLQYDVFRVRDYIYAKRNYQRRPVFF